MSALPKKRGPKTGTIAQAYAAVTTTPQPLLPFCELHGVSTHVMRQAKRFDNSGGTVHTKLNSNGVMVIWRGKRRVDELTRDKTSTINIEVICKDLKTFTIHMVYGSSPCMDPHPDDYELPIYTVDGKYLQLWAEYLQLDKIRKSHTLVNKFFQQEHSPDNWIKCKSTEQAKQQADNRCLEICTSAPTDETYMHTSHHFHRSEFKFGPYSEFILNDGSTVKQKIDAED